MVTNAADDNNKAPISRTRAAIERQGNFRDATKLQQSHQIIEYNVNHMMFNAVYLMA